MTRPGPYPGSVPAFAATSASAAPPTDADLTSSLGEHGQTLHYQKDKKAGDLRLYNVQVEFDEALTKNDEFYKRLAAVLIAKYGPLKDQKAVEKKLLTWGTPIGIAQLSTLGKTFPFRLTAPLDR